MYQLPNFNTGFITAVNSLPAIYNHDGYINFIQIYGTHYFYSLIMGARYGYQYKVATLVKAQTQNVDITLAASYKAEKSISGTNIKSIGRTANQSFSNEVSDEKIIVVGSRPPTNAEDGFEWSKNVFSNPMPISYTLRPIYELITSANFKTNPKISQISANMRNASTDNYCQSLLKIGKLTKCAPPNADKELPKTMNGCSLCKSCGGNYPVDGGQFAVDGNWPNCSRTQGDMCGGTEMNRNDLQSGMRLCCPETTPLNVGSCRLCTSCGGDWKNYGGSIMADQSWPNWNNAYSNS